MRQGKNVSATFRESPHFKRLLESAATHERRPQTDMLEPLLFAYCDECSINTAPLGTTGIKTPAGGFSK